MIFPSSKQLCGPLEILEYSNIEIKFPMDGGPSTHLLILAVLGTDTLKSISLQSAYGLGNSSLKLVALKTFTVLQDPEWGNQNDKLIHGLEHHRVNFGKESKI